MPLLEEEEQLTLQVGARQVHGGRVGCRARAYDCVDGVSERELDIPPGNGDHGFTY